MWWTILAWAEKPEGELPVFDNAAPEVTCCPDIGSLRAPIREKHADFRACWDLATPRTKTPTKLKWRITATGDVVDIEVALGHGDPLDACVRDVLTTLDVPAFGCDVVVSYPMPFAPGETRKPTATQ